MTAPLIKVAKTCMTKRSLSILVGVFCGVKMRELRFCWRVPHFAYQNRQNAPIRLPKPPKRAWLRTVCRLWQEEGGGVRSKRRGGRRSATGDGDNVRFSVCPLFWRAFLESLTLPPSPPLSWFAIVPVTLSFNKLPVQNTIFPSVIVCHTKTLDGGGVL